VLIFFIYTLLWANSLNFILAIRVQIAYLFNAVFGDGFYF